MILKKILLNTENENIYKCWSCILLEINKLDYRDKALTCMRPANTIRA